MNELFRVGLIAACMSGVVTAADLKSKLDSGVVVEIDQLVKSSGGGDAVTPTAVEPLFRAAVLADGNVESLLDWLSSERAGLKDARSAVLAEVEVHVAARRGDLQRASEVLNELLDSEHVGDDRVDLRIWKAKLHDALGEVDDARETYQQLIEQDLSEADQQMVRLRLALMGLLGTEAVRPKSDAKALIELAENSKDIAFRNRAANVLAVQNRHADAIKVFTIQGEGTGRFRSASRVTEWAIRAGERDKAIDSAWQATGSAELKRDRRYALALLVEAYRMKAKPKPTTTPAETKEKAVAATPIRGARPVVLASVTAAEKTADQPESAAEKKAPNKQGLEALIERFEEEQASGRPMSNEMRTVWIDLLRELERHEDAIRLFKASADQSSGFSIEMRRELLEMEGDAGNLDRVIESYRELIAAEPDQLTWRGGLTRILLEQGRDQEANELWKDYIANLPSGPQLLMSAQTLGNVGMDSLAEVAIERMVELRDDHGQGLLYLADLQKIRGRVEDAEATLMRLNSFDDVNDAVRGELASAFERVGRQDKAIEVTEAIRARRETVAEDVEMRLAWLYSEVGNEEKAMEQWLALWRKVNSIPRRRYIEDRLMTVSSRLGTLADIAIELEEKLADGAADDREAGLLVRIYSRVNDSVAASEILEEYMTQTGRNEIERLQEKGRIYQICNDYWNYEKVIERLIEVDPEGKTEYLRQLALSMLERGKAQEARDVLMTLRGADDGKDSIGGEFEAGVLSLVGLNGDAADAYRRGIATHPDRIESYLLLANLLKDMSQRERAVGMFQYLAENAERDDLFTIAIDGLLNMEARGKVMQWARRITLERLAGREDKNYLYQLLADLSAEVNDKSGQIRAMENSLAVSGTRRLSVLRECMDLSSRIRGGAIYSSSSRGPSNAGNKPFFAFGRRLIGLGELMPPQVFLDLGQAFLADGDVGSAERTFGMARNLADERVYQREVASIFENAGKLPEALVRYDRLLRTSPSDVALMARVAKLNEQDGNDAVAFRFYQRGLNLLLAQTPLTTLEENSRSARYSYRGNRDSYQTYSDRLLRGMLVTVPDDQIENLLREQRAEIDDGLRKIREEVDEDRKPERLADSPRLTKQTGILRRMYYAFGDTDQLESLESDLIKQFAEDSLATTFARERISHGRYDLAEKLLEVTPEDSDQHRLIRSMLGSEEEDVAGQKLDPREMWSKFLPAWMGNDMEKARSVLRRVDQSRGRGQSSSVVYTVVNGVLVPQQTGSAANVSSWMRMALHLKDEGLALQFARSRLQRGYRYGSAGIKSLFEGYRGILPADSYRDLVRFAANLYKEDENRLVEYLWIISQLRDQLDESDLPDDKKLLEMVEDSNISIGYQFPFTLAVETFPESIRGEAIAHTLDGIEKKFRPRELIRTPFQHDKPIDDETGKVILDAIKSGIQPALQDNYLHYVNYYLPRQGTAVRCPENAELALSAMELLDTKEVRKREKRVAGVAHNIKAVILHQMGRTDEALEFFLADYDPKESVTDYYQRYSRDWAVRELTSASPDRFMDAIAKEKDGEKRTTKQTDQRIRIASQSSSEDLIRREYETAVEQHPDEVKYLQQWERWEQRAGRIGAAIALKQRQIDALPDDESKESKAKAIKSGLGTLWFSVNHRVNGLPYWSINDDADKEKFETELKSREEAQAKAKDDAKEKPETPPKKPEPDKPKKDKSYAKTIVGVRMAVDDANEEAAKDSLRGIWRSFPPVVESPYSYRTRQKNFTGLSWPDNPSAKKEEPKKAEKPEPTEEEKLAAAIEKRRAQRGGLGTFKPPTPRTPGKKRQNAWNALAESPVGVSEMHRILRSRTPGEFASISTIVSGLLRADRLRDGDDKVFQSLVDRINHGRVGPIELAQFFEMVEEDPGKINEQTRSVIETLLDRLDLTQLKMASQLATICAQVGQNERAAALYKHCALLSPNQGVSFVSLAGDAKESLESESLLDVLEEMFALATPSESNINRMIDLRMELLDPVEAAERSEVLFEKLADDPDAYRMSQSMLGARLFSKAGNLELAARCLESGLRQHGKTNMPPGNVVYYGGTNRKTSVPTAELFKLFPKEPEGYQDYSAWLQTASQTIARLIADESIKFDIAVPAQSLVALRQNELGDPTAAAESLASITPEVAAQAKNYELLAIDVMRAVGLHQEARSLEQSLYDRKRLSHLRFGDLLRDTAAAGDSEATVKLADELLSQSLDEDLMEAAAEFAKEAPEFAKTFETIQKQREEAEAEYQSRREAAAERAKVRKQWKVDDAKVAVRP